MLEKYVEERYPRYFEFGQHKDGKVDVTSTHLDDIVTVSKEQAEELIKDRDKAIDALAKTALRFDEVAPEEFNKFWYGAEMVEHWK